MNASGAPLGTTIVDHSAGAYPTEDWEAAYFSTSRRGELASHQVIVRVPAGLDAVCPQIQIGQTGCVYGVRRWGFALRPSSLEAAGFDPAHLMITSNDAEAVRVILQAAAFELPGDFVIASPEHPFRLSAPDGTLRGSWIRWRTYLGALSFFSSGGEVDADFIQFWAEAEASYQQAVNILRGTLESAYPLPSG